MPSPFPQLPDDQRGTVTRHLVHAPCLEGNPWGDPARRDVFVHTPAQAVGPLPVVLALPAFAGTGEGLLARGLTDEPLSTRCDRLFAAGCPPFLTVLPDTMTSVGGSQYVDSPGIGAYLSFVVDVVRPFVDAHHATTGRWAVAGRSSGGFGAFNVAARDPDTFRAAAIHAGDAGFDLCYLGDLPKAIAGIQRAGGLDGFLPWFWSQHRPPGDAFAALNVLAMSCAYDPVPDRRPFPARLPFDVDTGAIDFEAFARWRVHDPVVRAADPRVQDALGRLDLLFVDAGDRDEYLLHLGAARLVDALRGAGLAVEHQTFPGGHRGTAFRWDVSLPRLAEVLHG